jgi:hypothetical protein
MGLRLRQLSRLLSGPATPTQEAQASGNRADYHDVRMISLTVSELPSKAEGCRASRKRFCSGSEE